MSENFEQISLKPGFMKQKIILADPEGLEPSTSESVAPRSIHWAMGPEYFLSENTRFLKHLSIMFLLDIEQFNFII